MRCSLSRGNEKPSVGEHVACQAPNFEDTGVISSKDQDQSMSGGSKCSRRTDKLRSCGCRYSPRASANKIEKLSDRCRTLMKDFERKSTFRRESGSCHRGSWTKRLLAFLERQVAGTSTLRHSVGTFLDMFWTSRQMEDKIFGRSWMPAGLSQCSWTHVVGHRIITQAQKKYDL